MQVIVNISDDEKITTAIKHEPATKETVSTSETAARNSLGADAGQFFVAADTEATQELSAEAPGALDGGAGPSIFR